mmetsp:Transcript_90169/g.270969  ORF Transcript_90169/g.270969 Transcript_90169/m.270969 type:complete len:306 (-) Transcript_90169:341-1258(-)
MRPRRLALVDALRGPTPTLAAAAALATLAHGAGAGVAVGVALAPAGRAVAVLAPLPHQVIIFCLFIGCEITVEDIPAPDEAHGDLALDGDGSALLVDVVGPPLWAPRVIRVRVAVDVELQVGANDHGPGVQLGTVCKLRDLARVRIWADDVLCISAEVYPQVRELGAILAFRDARGDASADATLHIVLRRAHTHRGEIPLRPPREDGEHKRVNRPLEVAIDVSSAPVGDAHVASAGPEAKDRVAKKPGRLVYFDRGRVEAAPRGVHPPGERLNVRTILAQRLLWRRWRYGRILQGCEVRPRQGPR